MTIIKLRDREIPLLYTTLEMKTIQEEVCLMNDFLGLLFGKKNDGTSVYSEPEHLNAIAKCIRILGNAGLEEKGLDPDLTDRWILRAMKPGRLNEYINTCLHEMNIGMESEIPPAEEEGPVDVTLEKLQKKKEKAG
jgi:hypothetical protein